MLKNTVTFYVINLSLIYGHYGYRKMRKDIRDYCVWLFVVVLLSNNTKSRVKLRLCQIPIVKSHSD